MKEFDECLERYGCTVQEIVNDEQPKVNIKHLIDNYTSPVNNENVCFRVTDELKELIEKESERLECSQAALCRAIVMKYFNLA